MRRLAAVVLVAACNATPPSTVANGSAAATVTGDKHTGSGAPVSVAAATASPKGGNLLEGGVKPHHEEQVVECPANVADTLDDDSKVSALLDEANKQIESGVFGAAWTCADRAGGGPRPRSVTDPPRGPH